MRVLLALTVVMGVLIVLGTATVAVTILHRMGAASHAAAPRPLPGAVLDEPPGTHIVSAAAYGDRLALVLQGGGPDRVLLFDPATGHTLARIALKP